MKTRSHKSESRSSEPEGPAIKHPDAQQSDLRNFSNLWDDFKTVEIKMIEMMETETETEIETETETEEVTRGTGNDM